MNRFKKISMIFPFIFIQNLCVAEPDLEIPSYKLTKTSLNDSFQSSNPELLARQFEYKSSASTEELLKFYRDNPYVKSCEYNTTGENYRCELNKYKKVSSGTIYILPKAENGLTTVFADYFSFK